MSNEAKRTTLYFSQEDVEAIENWAKTKKLSFSKAAIDLMHKGINKDKYEENKVNEHEQKLRDTETSIKENKNRILALEMKLERMTELLAATRLGEIHKDFAWDEEQPPEKQIPIYLWYDCSNPNKKKSEKYGLTKHDLIYKVFGSQGDYLFKQWYQIKELKNDRQQAKYLCEISGAKYRTVKLPGNQRESWRYVINHLFDTQHIFEKKQTLPNAQPNQGAASHSQ